MGFKPYPKYKDSGVPWFGNVPEHWQTPRLGAVLMERKETNKENGVTKILSVMRDVGVIPYEEKGNVGNKCSEDITRYKIVRPGDIVANCMNIIIGSVGLSKYTGCLSPVYYVLTPRSQEDDSRFFDYVFKLKPFQLSLVRLGNGIMAHRMRIPMELLKCETVPKPPADEQKAIVGYLDVVNKIIHRYIREKQKVIKLLNEQKQAIINKAVTRGIDPNVRLKPSGVDWLGDIPERWEVRRLKHLCRFSCGDSLPDRDRKDGEVSVYGSNGQVGSHNNANTLTPCLIIGRKGSFGKVNYSHTSVFAIDTTYFVDASQTNENVRWLYYLLLWVKLDSVTKDSAVPGLDRNEAYSQLVPHCSLEEQKEIASFLDQRIAEYDKAISFIAKEIDLLREYRSCVISDVVTGKVDVRDIKLPEIEEISKSEPIEEQEIPEDMEDTEEVVNADE